MRNVAKIGLGAVGGITVTGLSIWGLTEAGLIFPNEFQWGDFATLLSGALAVGAAVWVGDKQMKITAEQTTIARNQAEIMFTQANIQQSTLRSELYDRRIKILAKIKRFYATTHDDRDELPDEKLIIAEMVDAAESAKFLFNEDVSVIAWDLYDLIKSVRTQKRMIRNAAKEGKMSIISDAEHAKLSAKLHQKMGELSKVTTPIMRIG